MTTSTAADPTIRSAADVKERLERLCRNIERVMVGKSNVVRLAVIAILADGHLLLEDVPGVGKTLLAKALARSLNCSFARVQFTPDLLPTDLVGASIFHQPSGSFQFQPGPIFSQILLADEINRATPRTQSALLEAMSERQVTIDGKTRRLDPPFLVIATQNPYEFEGTFPLPENQLDRFLLRLHIGYPERSAERAMLTLHCEGEPVDQLEAVLTTEELIGLQKYVRTVKVSEPIAEYILDLIAATRTNTDLLLGASPRAALALYRAVQASAVLDGREFTTPDDVQKLAVPLLGHRLLAQRWNQGNAEKVIAGLIGDMLKRLPIPS